MDPLHTDAPALETLTPPQQVELYAKYNEQKKEAEAVLEQLKSLIINNYKWNSVVETENWSFKVSIRSKKAIKFSEEVTPERIKEVLKENPSVAFDFAIAMKNTGAGLASKLDIIMDDTETFISETTFPVITLTK
jgi:hypothetical protein